MSFLYLCLQELHAAHDKDISADELITYFWVKYPEADQKTYAGLLKTVQELQISPDVGDGIVKAQKERRSLLKLTELGFKVSQGFAKKEDLVEFFNKEINKDDHQPDSDLPLSEINLDLGELIEHAYKEQGLRWRLDCLNKSLGGLRKGDFGFIFARPETGKTTFLASEVSSFIKSDGSIVWFNNEEQGDKVGIRLLQAYFGVTLDTLKSNVQKFRQIFLAETAGRLRLFDAAIIDRKDVERIVAKLNPSLVIYDQIDKIRGFANDREDLRLGSIYQWARELAKGSHAAIGVCQADGTAEGVRYLTMEHVANAKTAKQAEADFIIGIGKTSDDEYARYINISKNKLFGDEDSIPDLRHGRFQVVIEPTIARYKDVINFE